MRRQLGSFHREIAPLGLGCVGLSHAYGRADPAESVDTIQRALDLGCSLLDTADSYGAGENERLVGRAIKHRRDEVVLATKVGFVWDSSGKVIGRDGSPAYIRSAIEASLRRLDTDVIDLYTLHRVDPAVPIEESVRAMAELVTEGKVRAIGLSEVTVDELRRAHAVHPITAVQSEYSLWNREPEREVMPVCRELGVAFVAFSPLGRGVFSGTVQSSTLAEGDFRRTLPRFEAERLEAVSMLVRKLEAFSIRTNATSSQVALSWILHKGENVFAIPGTRHRKHLEENMGALTVRLPPEQIGELDDLFAPELDFGPRYAPGSAFSPRTA